MHHKHILTAACAGIAAFGGIATADILPPLGQWPSSACSGKSFTSQFNTGYATKYVSRGLAFQNGGSDHVVPLEYLGSYALNKKISLIGGFQYQWLTQNNFTHGDTGISDEASLLLGASRQFSKWTTASLSYQFVNGGLPGSLNVHKGQSRDFPPFFEHSRTEEHSIVLDFHHEFGKGLEGWFWNSRVQYTVQWMPGWWFTNTLGYKYDYNKSVSAIFSGTWNATAGYFDRDSLNANGSQGFSLDVTVPCKVTRHLTVSPFASTVWLGNGGMAANRRGVSDRFPTRATTKVYRNFTFVAGVGLSYTF